MCVFPALVKLLLHINELMPNSQREASCKQESQKGKSKGFWHLEMRLARSFHSPLLHSLLNWTSFWSLFSAISFSSLCSVNEPGGLAGNERSPGSQDLGSKERIQDHHAGFQTAHGQAYAFVCTLVRSSGGLSVRDGLKQELTSEVVSERRQKWSH